MTIWRCSSCGRLVKFNTEAAMEMAKNTGGCDGCRMYETLKRKPHMTSIILESWTRTGPPIGNKWVLAVPDELLEFYGYSVGEKIIAKMFFNIIDDLAGGDGKCPKKMNF